MMYLFINDYCGRNTGHKNGIIERVVVYLHWKWICWLEIIGGEDVNGFNDGWVGIDLD